MPRWKRKTNMKTLVVTSYRFLEACLAKIYYYFNKSHISLHNGIVTSCWEAMVAEKDRHLNTFCSKQV